MLETIQHILNIPDEKLIMALQSCGNTVSSSIPLAIQSLWERKKSLEGKLAMLVGFGVGLSYGGVLVHF